MVMTGRLSGVRPGSDAAERGVGEERAAGGGQRHVVDAEVAGDPAAGRGVEGVVALPALAGGWAVGECPELLEGGDVERAGLGEEAMPVPAGAAACRAGACWAAVDDADGWGDPTGAELGSWCALLTGCSRLT